jgi:NAD(P)-dependent dehydrogenase (short-subunit alcohol dehydrogenase family)
MELSAKNQRVLITAGGGGIGRVMAETFVNAGAKVHICDVDAEGRRGEQRKRIH